jgi:NTP pyrophosphatase (non-canonical NTP hydrolase)
MIKLNEIAKKSLQNAKDRGQGTDTIKALKHCAGEVLESVEAYTRFVYSPKEEADTFPDELADVIMCILTISAAENIDIEKAILSCLEKNRKRAEIEREFR